MLPTDAGALVELLDHYAREQAGGGEPLSEQTKRSLPGKLAQRPDAFSFLAYVGGRPVGLLNAFEGFSTFAAAPLLNVHDVVVHRDYRGRGIAHRLLEAAESLAIERGCCRLTLEVLTANRPAIALYERFGFASYRLDDAFGHAVFLQKRLGPTWPS